MKLLYNLYTLFRKAKKYILREIVKSSFKTYGKNFKFDPNSVFAGADKMEFGENVFIGEGAHFSIETSLKVGDNVLFGPRVIIMGGDHNFKIQGKSIIESGKGIQVPIVIEDDVWIGSGSIILKGVTIRKGAVVGAGSVVSRDIPEYSIAIGSPAKRIRGRFDKK